MTLAFIGCEPPAAMPLEVSLCCDHCEVLIHGEPINLPNAYSACDTDCADSLGYTPCYLCGDWHDKKSVEYDPQGNSLCTDCFADNYRICEDCDEIVASDDTHWEYTRGFFLCLLLLFISSFAIELRLMRRYTIQLHMVVLGVAVKVFQVMPFKGHVRNLVKPSQQ